jgi:hypothetical protein
VRTAKPVVINYTLRDVALIVMYASFGNPDRYAKQVGLSKRKIKRIVEQKDKPTESILQFHHLEQIGDHFSWTIQ